MQMGENLIVNRLSNTLEHRSVRWYLMWMLESELLRHRRHLIIFTPLGNFKLDKMGFEGRI